VSVMPCVTDAQLSCHMKMLRVVRGTLTKVPYEGTFVRWYLAI